METIRQLPEQFSGTGEVRGYDFVLICKTSKALCYKVSIDGISVHYEVFRLKINNRFACESYPTSKAFGIWAFTYKCLGKAIQKLKTL